MVDMGAGQKANKAAILGARLGARSQWPSRRVPSPARQDRLRSGRWGQGRLWSVAYSRLGDCPPFGRRVCLYDLGVYSTPQRRTSADTKATPMNTCSITIVHCIYAAAAQGLLKRMAKQERVS